MPETTTQTGAQATTQAGERPEPGLARGRWEAPPWAFALAPAAMLALVLTWLVIRLRMRRRRR
jgi:hypothetical protein